MRRRDLFLGSIGLAAGNLVFPQLLRRAVAASLPSRIIDVHCHIFNADDLPMVEFMEKAVIRGSPEYQKQMEQYQALINLYLTALADWLKGKAFSAHDELKQLDAVDADSGKARSPEKIQENEIAALTALITDWKDKAPPIPSSLKGNSKLLAAYLPGLVIGFLHREIAPGTFSGPQEFKANSFLDNGDWAFSREYWFPPRYVAEQCYNSVPGVLSHGLKWMLLFTRYRYELADDVHQVGNRRAVLLTPSMVDYTRWLDAKESTQIPEQIGVMERIGRRRIVTNRPRVHGFVPFDPLRQAIHEKLGKPANESPLAWVQEAVTKRGFLGVKLYPPIGFRPSNNVQAGNDFPCWVRFGAGSPGYGEKCATPTNTSDGLGDAPGAKFDAILRRLYPWCADNNVPILTHANNSMGAGPGYGTRADPVFWQAVIAEFPTLRVNLAHFGNFNAAFKDGKFDPQRLDKTWEWTIGSILKSNTNTNAYADISDFTELMVRNSPSRKNLLTSMQKFKAQFSGASKLLMYGTDWSMLARTFDFLPFDRDDFPQLVADFLAEAGFNTPEELNDIFFGNAVRFLGLGQGGQNDNRHRLEKFYADAGLNADWLNVFN